MQKLIGARLKSAREEADLNQADVAEALGIQRNSYTQIETGRNLIQIKHLLKLPEILGKPLSYFVDAPTGNLQPDEEELLSLYRALPPGFPRQSATGILRTLLEVVRRNRGLGDDGKPLSTGQEEPE